MKHAFEFSGKALEIGEAWDIMGLYRPGFRKTILSRNRPFYPEVILVSRISIQMGNRR
jgi:hypothetical protein